LETLFFNCEKNNKKIRQTPTEREKKPKMFPPNPWHRLYLRSEWKRRHQRKKSARILQKLQQKYTYLKELCMTLKHELSRSHRRIRSQELAISAQQNAIHQFKLPAFASFRLCTPAQHEVCPLSLTYISCSSLPFAPDVVYNPAQPRHTCTELECGHRFSAMHLIFHFIKNSTFQCPLCGNGQRHFRFNLNDVPVHLRGLFRRALE
jgi:hypothetical protein